MALSVSVFGIWVLLHWKSLFLTFFLNKCLISIVEWKSSQTLALQMVYKDLEYSLMEKLTSYSEASCNSHLGTNITEKEPFGWFFFFFIILHHPEPPLLLTSVFLIHSRNRFVSHPLFFTLLLWKILNIIQIRRPEWSYVLTTSPGSAHGQSDFF